MRECQSTETSAFLAQAPSDKPDETWEAISAMYWSCLVESDASKEQPEGKKKECSGSSFRCGPFFDGRRARVYRVISQGIQP